MLEAIRAILYDASKILVRTCAGRTSLSFPLAEVGRHVKVNEATQRNH